jgi:hypothetical protein
MIVDDAGIDEDSDLKFPELGPSWLQLGPFRPKRLFWPERAKT